MKTTIEEARLVGDRQYNTGKPCRNDHFSPRYTSTGNCLECMRIHREERKQMNRMAKRMANSIRSKEKSQYTAPVPFQWHGLLDKIQALAMRNDGPAMARISTLVDAIHDRGGRPITRIERDELRLILNFDGSKVTNYSEFPIYEPSPGSRDDDVCIQIYGRWYKAGEIMLVLRGQKEHVDPHKPLDVNSARG